MTETKFLEEHTVEKNNVTGYVEVCISCVPLDYSKAEKIKEILEILCCKNKNNPILIKIFDYLKVRLRSISYVMVFMFLSRNSISICSALSTCSEYWKIFFNITTCLFNLSTSRSWIISHLV